jgi:hypothetical protein
MTGIQDMRKDVPHALTRSVRMEFLCNARFEKDPDVAVQEAMRIARNADYFSSHLNFARRLCDIAEKMRFLEVKERASALEAELEMLNASGAMGGDPLNRVAEHHIRVVGLPKTEGHVFRSKERTPVLLLTEVFDDTVEDDQQQQAVQSEESRPKKTLQTKTKSEEQKDSEEAPAFEVSTTITPTQDKEEKKLLSNSESNTQDAGKETKIEAESDDADEISRSPTDDGDDGEEKDSAVDESMNNSDHGPQRPVDEDEMYSPKHIRSADSCSEDLLATPQLPLEGSLDDSSPDHKPRKYFAPHSCTNVLRSASF